jgi:hypothetical protein
VLRDVALMDVLSLTNVRLLHRSLITTSMMELRKIQGILVPFLVQRTSLVISFLLSMSCQLNFFQLVINLSV